MNLKTTLALVVLAACALGVVFTQGRLPSWIDSRRQPVSASAQTPGFDLSAASLQKIEIRRLEIIDDRVRSAAVALVARPFANPLASLPAAWHVQIDLEPIRLERAGDVWVMPGNWPTRPNEVARLVELLTALKSRFEPITPDGNNPDEYGTDKPAVVVTVKTRDNEEHVLSFGDRPSDGPRFLRPTYLRTNGVIWRLGPGIIASLDRPAEYYLQRRLFPSKRVAREEGSAPRVDRLVARKVEVEQLEFDPLAKDGKGKADQQSESIQQGWRYALISKPQAQGGDDVPATWELAEPSRDAIDPAARDRLLEAVAELWAERFLDADLTREETTGLSAEPKKDKSAPRSYPLRRLTVTREDGRAITLYVGKPVDGKAPPPIPLPNQPAPKQTYYARVDGSKRIFEINGDKIGAIFVPPDQLRDSQLARFTPADARQIKLTTKKGTVLLRNEAKQAAAGSDETPADWRIVEPSKWKADSATVTRLLTALSSASAREKDAGKNAKLAGVVGLLGQSGTNALTALASGAVLGPWSDFGFDLKKAPAATIEVTVEESKRDRPTKTKKTYTVRLGDHDALAKRLYATSEDWPRINEISDELAPLVLNKSALDYRHKQLFDPAPADVAQLQIVRLDLPSVAGGALGLMTTPSSLARLGFVPGALADKSGVVVLERTDGAWQMTAPVRTEADADRVKLLVERLSKLEVLSWTGDVDGKGQDGMGAPLLRVTLTDAKRPKQTLLIGKMRTGAVGHFARLADHPETFVVPDDLVAMLERDSLEYRPANLWRVANDDVTKLRIARAGQAEYTLERKGDDWEVSGPFSVKAAPRPVIDRLVQTLASPFALGYRTHAATDFAPYGLAKPPLEVTLTTKQGKEHTLWIGEKAGSPSGRYARLGEKQAAVFVVTEALARAADQSALDFLERDLLTFNPDQVVSFSRARGADVLEMKKDEDVWKLTKPSEQAADDDKVPALFKALAALRAERIVAYKPADLAPFGLDKPEATVTLKLAEDAKPAQVELLLGGVVKDKPDSRYAMVKGGPMVGELSADVVKRLLAGPLAYRDHLVAKLAAADAVKLEAGARKATFANTGGTWKLTQPLAARADHDALEDFVTGLAKLRADEIVSDKPTPEQLKAFGLDKPSFRWQFVADDETKLDLLIGAAEKGGVRRYAKLQGRDVVFLLDPKLSARAAAEYRSRAVFEEPIDPAGIESVKFGHSEGGFELKKTDEGWEVVGKADAKVNVKLLSDTLAALRDLKLERYVADDKAELKLYGLDPAALTLEVTTGEGKRTLLLGGLEGGTKRRYARVPGGKAADVFVLDEATSTKLFRDLASLTQK